MSEAAPRDIRASAVRFEATYPGTTVRPRKALLVVTAPSKAGLPERFEGWLVTVKVCGPEAQVQAFMRQLNTAMRGVPPDDALQNG